ncbi:hypothetical protein EV191_102146 [Tamaricihabitans halophyticus]|uniref:Uncharacterized protein n=1 Tax=Tamaricihabitans halophyticus TaxID=1262583 RepID=A0A4V2SUK9_9PSEU|nr:hypothetical protein [Tamaricihabitans halophyticus]TCP54936.1 hypothetical protein EV191_102146 [Tamaricihabitans halophyticus]
MKAILPLLVLFFAAACTGAEAEGPKIEKTNLELGVSTGSGGMRVVYTCGSGEPCVHQADEGGYWEETVTVPKGTTVRLQVTGGVFWHRCWIKDGELFLDKDTEGQCSAKAE